MRIVIIEYGWCYNIIRNLCNYIEQRPMTKMVHDKFGVFTLLVIFPYIILNGLYADSDKVNTGNIMIHDEFFFFFNPF